MAERVTDFPTPPRQTRRYPWAEWTDGSTWRLVRGVDFDAPVDNFRDRLFSVAKRRNLKVTTSKATEGEVEVLYAQFFGDPDSNGH